jgi:hypothetical protein
LAVAVSTHWPPQNSAALNGWQLAVQPPVRVAAHDAWQSTFSCTWQDAWQLVWHSDVQSTLPVVSSHW